MHLAWGWGKVEVGVTLIMDEVEVGETVKAGGRGEAGGGCWDIEDRSFCPSL